MDPDYVYFIIWSVKPYCSSGEVKIILVAKQGEGKNMKFSLPKYTYSYHYLWITITKLSLVSGEF